MRKALFLFLFLSFQSLAFAEISLRCEVDKKSITTDDQLTYKLIVRSSEKNIPAPQPPAFRGFSVLSQEESSTLIFGKGDLKTLLIYTYILAPLQAGKFKIEPSTITVKDKTYASQEIEIEVTKGRQHPTLKPEEKLKSAPEKGLSDLEGTQVTL